MRTVGLIVEYNPLHNGHVYHFQESMKLTQATHSVAVMSGNFLQRGEPAIVNKWARTEMALSIGIDLVLEIPLLFATQSAEIFAHGAVSILHHSRCVDSLCFGSESGELDWLLEGAKKIAQESQRFKNNLKEYLSQGFSYPKAYGTALQSELKDWKIPLDQPNNILGFHYLLALERLKSPIVPMTIQRKKSGYNQKEFTDPSIASATAIRNQIFYQQGFHLESIAPYVPTTSLNILEREWKKGRGPVSWDDFYHTLTHLLLSKDETELSSIIHMEQGLPERIKKQLLISPDFISLMKQIKTKRYAWTRLQRLLLHTLLNITQQKAEQCEMNVGPAYIRVLGFSQKGQELLAKMKKRASLPIISRISKAKHPMLQLDVLGSQIYSLGYKASGHSGLRMEYEQPPIQLKH
ncbi:nucleotidyltransferase [Microaerobacter geothermalis]|nr:nucleotidyltransferase [Microaerobacter geothermalis]